ncbi:MAG: DUF47 family protein, partial [Deltaproteobacteria bacterium]|nr:DUF47 family protein [Deltaproteobacteria bacterium]
ALVLAAETIDKVVGELHHLKYSQRIIDHCIEINRLENEGDRLLKQAVANLFENERDPIEVIKWKEIYENVEMALDKCEDVANVIEGVMLKHA